MDQISTFALLYRLDVDRASLAEPVAVPGVDSIHYADRALSPSGTSWLRLPTEQGESKGIDPASEAVSAPKISEENEKPIDSESSRPGEESGKPVA